MSDSIPMPPTEPTLTLALRPGQTGIEKCHRCDLLPIVQSFGPIFPIRCWELVYGDETAGVDVHYSPEGGAWPTWYWEFHNRSVMNNLKNVVGPYF
jgi:hypothetical protein